MTAIFEKRILTKTYFIILAVLVVLATLANYFNFTVTNAFCADGAGISCALSSNYEFIKLMSFVMIVAVMLYVIYLAWVYDTGVTEEKTEGIIEEDIQDDIDNIEVISSEDDIVTPTQEFLPGFYLEVELDSTSTGRTIEHEGGDLPKVLKEGNYWIPLQKEETEELNEVDYSQYEHHKPGNRVTPGYYLEIDENFESVGRYIYQEKKLPPTGKSGHFWVLVVDKNDEPVIEEPIVVELTEFSEREAVLSKQEAEAGFYLEVEEDDTPTGRMVEHEGGCLPKVLKEGNHWIPLQQEETEEFVEVDYSKHELHKPGNRVTPGYYLEIDENFESVGRYIYQEKKLPPTGKTGHFWVLVVDKNENPATEEPNKYSERKVTLSDQEAEAGFYLEVDEDNTQTGRMIEHEGGRLPQVLKEGNYWIPLAQEETEEYIEEDYSKLELHKPGNRVTPGYYLEINENYESIGRYIYQERKLPPTTKKRHLWVLVADKADYSA